MSPIDFAFAFSGEKTEKIQLIYKSLSISALPIGRVLLVTAWRWYKLLPCGIGLQYKKSIVLFIFEKFCGNILLRHSLIIFPAGILLVKMYAWSSYPAGK